MTEYERKRRLNERKFGAWEDLPGGGRRYWFEIEGRRRWRARYVKEVDAEETTMRFCRKYTMTRVSSWSGTRNTLRIAAMSG